MPTHREIKEQLEEFSAKELAKRVCPSAVPLGPGDPNQGEPDFLFRDGEYIIGIESTTASYSNDLLRNDFHIHSHPEELRQRARCLFSRLIFGMRSSPWIRSF
jgi:hypothetical protein